MPITCDTTTYVDTAEAAALLDVSVSRIRQLSDAGRLGNVFVYDVGIMREKGGKSDQYRPSWYTLAAVSAFQRRPPGPQSPKN